MAYASATIPTGLLEGGPGTHPSDQGWSFGPFKIPFPFPAQQDSGNGSSSSSGSARTRLATDVHGAVRHFREAVSSGLHPSSGRGGTASSSAARGAAARRDGGSTGAQLEYSEDTPRLLGNRSVALRPRHTLPLSGWEPVYDDRDTRWWDVKETAMHGSYSWALQDYQSDREDPPVPGDAWRADVPSDVELAPVLTCRDLVKQVLVDQQQQQPGRSDAVQCAFPDQPCPVGSYKVMAFTSPIPEDDPAANYCDHHFYVQHKDVAITLQPGDKLGDVARFFKLTVDDLYDANPGLAAIPPHLPLDRERNVRVRDANVWSHKPSEWLPPRLHDGSGRAIHNPLRAVAAFSDDEGGMNELPGQYCCSFCVRPGQAKTGPQARAPAGAGGGGGQQHQE